MNDICRKMIFAAAIFCLPWRLAAQPFPDTSAYNDCAVRVAETPSCALDLAYQNATSDDPEQEIIFHLIKIFRKGKLTFGFDPVTPIEESAREIAENWLVEQFSGLDLLDKHGRFKDRYADRLTILAEAGMPRAIKALLPTNWGAHPMNVCASEALLAAAHATAGDSENAIFSLQRAQQEFYRAQKDESERGRQIFECKISQWGMLAVSHMLIRDNSAAAAALYRLVAPLPADYTFPFSLLAPGFSPDALEEFLPRIEDPSLEADAWRAFVISLATHGRIDEASRIASILKDDPGRMFALTILMNGYAKAGRFAEARAMAEHEPRLDQEKLERLITRLEKHGEALPTPFLHPKSVALEGRVSKAMRLLGDPDARWNTGVTKERLKAKNRLPVLLTIYVLAEAMRAPK